MSFTVWFQMWVRSFFKLLTIGATKRKSDAQRKREHECRMKAKRSRAWRFQSKKRRSRPRSSLHVWFEKAMLAMIDFAALSLGILFLPLGLFDWGHKSIKAKKAAKQSASQKSKTQKSAPSKSATHTQISKPMSASHKTSSTEVKREEKKPTLTITPSPKVKPSVEVKRASTSTTVSKVATLEDVQNIPAVVKKEIPVELNENIPKSTPKNEKDQYIRKRMIIAGSSYCEKEALDTLTIGTCFDVALEPDNPHDKEAVKLTYNGQKIGYISKADKPAFVTCLRLGRKVYGVITDINTEVFPTQYEFETWFDSNK